MRRRSAVLAAIMRQPDTVLHRELRSQSVDEVWDRFRRNDPALPDVLRTRFASVDADALCRRSEQCGSRIVIPGDPEWPIPLDDLGDRAPWAIWLRGQSLSIQRSVAVVGSRSCTTYGERTAAELAHGIADTGSPVISGGAFGIDAAAHRGALAASGPTVAVLACGVDVAYPAAHSALFERIAQDGTIVSESMPGARPTRAAFLVRNRIIAALGYGTVVVEARYRSGALSTSREANELNRLVMGVPGPITSAESAGVHELIKCGAQLVTSAADVLSLVAPLGTVAGELRDESRCEWDELTALQRQVYDAFPQRACIGVTALRGALDSDTPVAALLGALGSLAQRGLVVEELDGGWRRLRKPRAAAV